MTPFSHQGAGEGIQRVPLVRQRQEVPIVRSAEPIEESRFPVRPH